jgi:pyruvate dehydrogenase E2 component (dihydrolipoamide acetyltransferase)
MTFEIRLPQYGMGMQDGLILKWLKKEGDSVEEGEFLLEIEAAKTVVEVPSPVSGTVGRILAEEGDTVEVRTVIAIINLAEGATAPAPETESEATAEIPQTKTATPPTTSPTPARSSSQGEPQIEPAARRRAKELGITDLTGITGTGPRGRITIEDIEGAGQPSGAKQDSPASADSDEELVPLSHTRQIVARHLTEAKSNIPHFYLEADCRVDALLDARSRINETSGQSPLSITDFIVKAAAYALKQEPDLNVAFAGTGLRRFKRVHVAVAVATDDGLLAPVLRDVDTKPLGMVGAELKALSQRARAGQLPPEELEGGTFTVSNLGMFGTSRFTAILNPPQAAILAVGAVERRPVVSGDKLEIAHMLTCTLSVDHRAVNGAMAARFLAVLKKALEDPTLITG